MKLVQIAALVFVLGAGLAHGEEPVRLSADTYLISQISKAGIFASMSKLKSRVIAQANTFAERQGKIAVALSLQEFPAGGPGQWPRVEYQFRVVSADDPEAQRGALAPRADVVIDSNQKISVDVKSSEKPDLYAELVKLDDLRKRGILTDAEFEAQKKKLLEAREH